MTTDIQRINENLTLGRGSTSIEVFLEPSCPYSEKAFRKLAPFLEMVGEDRVRLTIRLLPQPWHLFTPALSRCVLGAAWRDDGRAAAIRTMTAIYDNRLSFVCDRHCEGPNVQMSPADVLARVSEYSGLDLSEGFAADAVTAAVKWHVRYGRQNGAHFTPTFIVDGIVDDRLSSGQEVAEWADALGLRG